MQKTETIKSKEVLFVQKRLFKSTKNVMVSGVCGGIAEYLNLDPSLIRILWVIVSLASVGLGIIAYIACSIILPRDIDINNNESK